MQIQITPILKVFLTLCLTIIKLCFIYSISNFLTNKLIYLESVLIMILCLLSLASFEIGIFLYIYRSFIEIETP